MNWQLFGPTPTLSIPTFTVTPTPYLVVTKAEIISWVNSLRSDLDYRGLKEDPFLNASAQDAAQIMADGLPGHAGSVRERIPLYGYNNGYEVFATENYVTGPMTMDEIAVVWADFEHQRIVENYLYCHIGVGMAEAADGTIYYVVHGAYPAFQNGCAYRKQPEGATPIPTPGAYAGITGSAGNPTGFSPGVSQVIAAVRVATPDAEGRIIHNVKNGQSLWGIAAAYGVDINDLAKWNHLNTHSPLALGQQLVIPDAETMAHQNPPTAIPTILATMGADGKFRHVVQSGETVWSIAELWKADLAALKQINGLNDDVTLGVGWKLFIPVTPTVTPFPTATLTMTATVDEPAIRAARVAEIVETALSETMTVEPTTTPKPVGHLPHGLNVRALAFLTGIAVLMVLCGMMIGSRIWRKR